MSTRISCYTVAAAALVASTALSGIGSAHAAQVYIDTREAPQLTGWANNFRRDINQWYPWIAGYLRSEGYTAPQKFTITFSNTMDRQALCTTAGISVVCYAKYFKDHPDDQGALIHELVHVVQQYPGDNPGWLVEGIADYIRWFVYEPVGKRPHPNLSRASYTDGYATTGGFLNFVVKHYDKWFVVRMNQAMREGRYHPSLWQKYTGKTIQQLWQEYVYYKS